MNPQRWRQVRDLFAQAADSDPDRRDAFLQNACAGDPDLRREVESLLAADAASNSLVDQPFFNLHPESSEPTLRGHRIGPYKVLKEIGRGGLGAVYLAERVEFKQRVALKVIKRGMDTEEVVRRFRRERQILANLEHPHVARLLDGGSTEDGLPYFVMELVDGERLDRYCDARKLPIEARLRLFLQVASAVAFAHRNLVVHRDLKPSNVLVSDGQSKLLDFGIAKLLTPDQEPETRLTSLGSTPMTPDYASPEQARGEAVTTASDVYSLGVVLYELVTGQLPYRLDDCDALERTRRICEQEPRRPSTVADTALAPDAVSETREGSPRKLRRRLAGDLDSIVLKALRKEPANRYGSVEQLADDLRRHLDGLPVLAREGTLLYRTGKFLRRNRWRLMAAVVLLLLTAAGVVTRMETARQIAEAELAERLASERAQEADRQAEIRAELLQNLFTASDLRRNESFTVRELLARARERIRSNLKGEPLATQLEIMGLVYGDLGLPGEARQLLEDSLRLRRELYDGDHPLLARVLNNLAAWHYQAGDYERAGTLYQESLEMRRRLGQKGVDLVKAMSNLASIRMTRGEYARAEELYRQVLAIREQAYGGDDPSVATSLRSLGTLLYLRGDAESAEPPLRRALEIRRRHFGDRDVRVAAARSSLARALHARGKYRQAERLLTAVLATRRELLGEDHPHVALTKKDLAALLLEREKPLTAEALAEAEVLLTQALGILRASKAEGSWEVADAESLWGVCLMAQGRYEEAEPYLIEGYLRLRKLRGPEAIYTRNAHRRLVELYAAWGRPAPDG